MDDFETYELNPEDFPFQISIIDKDGNQVDLITVPGPGVVSIDGYPEEGRPYTARVIREVPEPETLQTVMDSSVGFSRWTGL